MQLRGGIGLFQGDAPQVWLSNSYNTTGFNYSTYNRPGPTPRTCSSAATVATSRSRTVGAQGPRTSISFAGLRAAVGLEGQPGAFDTQTGLDDTVFSAEVLLTEVNKALYYQSLKSADPVAGQALRRTLIGPDGRELYYNPSLVNKAWSTSDARYNRNTAFDEVYPAR